MAVFFCLYHLILSLDQISTMHAKNWQMIKKLRKPENFFCFSSFHISLHGNKYRDMREHIIKETTKLFVQHGLKAIRMDDIASQLGISKRTIYEIFSDKETLIYDCMVCHHDQIHKEKMDKMSKAGNIIEEFVLLFDNWDEEIDANYKLMMSLKKFYPNIHRRIVDGCSRAGFDSLREKLKAGVDQGYLLKDVNYELAVSVFTYSIYGIISNQTAILPSDVSEKEAFKYVIVYFFRGIATEKGRKLIDEYLEK